MAITENPVELVGFLKSLGPILPRDQIFTGDLERFARGTDASFYRLTPQAVVVVKSEVEVSALLDVASKHKVPLTFRAAGTSLSGQAVTDSVLVMLGFYWRGSRVAPDGSWVELEPGLTGTQANTLLAPHGKKIGPDPASIDAAMMGGIAANNASGMCCGVSQNCYHTLKSMRVVFSDGSVLDSGDLLSRRQFEEGHPQWVRGLRSLMERAREPGVAELLRKKYRIKNTTGYGLNALLDFEDPVDVLAHLMIGSEGTLGFISRIVLKTVDEHPFKSAALLIFKTMTQACSAVTRLATSPAVAVELLDRPALAAVTGMPGISPSLATLPSGAAALLVECRGPDIEWLRKDVAAVRGVLLPEELLEPAGFTEVASEIEALWKVRKGVFPAVGATRKAGTTVIIEDVAFPMEHLESGIRRIQELMARHGHPDGVIFGHALAGNIHFVFSQSFSDENAVGAYGRFMDEVATAVLERGGSLKAEHGTGRNMAPYVEREWGPAVTAIMWDLKALLDPQGILNPGVVLSTDPETHLKNLKPMPETDPLVDSCIECGFCEPRCPSRHLTLTPRQRITVSREISRRNRAGEAATAMEKAFQYQGVDTCAADGLCSTACPVGIDTGKLMVKMRTEGHGAPAKFLAACIAENFSLTARTVRLGSALMPFLPRPARVKGAVRHSAQKVVYFPSCMSRTLGGEATGQVSTPEAVLDTLAYAGYEAILPQGYESFCCGKAFESKGFPHEGKIKGDELAAALERARENGKWPLLIDTSPCALHHPAEAFPVSFLATHVLPKLNLKPSTEALAFHIPCSDRKMGLVGAWKKLAAQLCTQPIFPEDTDCCGFAGDRGFLHPELNESALRFLKNQLPLNCKQGVSSSRGCEIGLGRHSGRPYQSLFHLVRQMCREQGLVPLLSEARPS